MSSAERRAVVLERAVVLDTGVLVSAAIRPGSVPALAVHKALMHFDVCVSGATWLELETVLSRAKFDAYLPLVARQAFVEGLREHVTFVDAPAAVTDCVDPADNKFLDLALAANAEVIVSRDPHLTTMHPWRGIPIVVPAGFLVAVV